MRLGLATNSKPPKKEQWNIASYRKQFLNKERDSAF